MGEADNSTEQLGDTLAILALNPWPVCRVGYDLSIDALPATYRYRYIYPATYVHHHCPQIKLS